MNRSPVRIWLVAPAQEQRKLCSVFFVKKKLRPNPCSFAITKSHARFDCSVVNALATSHCRYQLFARVLTTFAKVNRICISRQRKLCSVFLSKKTPPESLLHCYRKKLRNSIKARLPRLSATLALSHVRQVRSCRARS